MHGVDARDRGGARPSSDRAPSEPGTSRRGRSGREDGGGGNGPGRRLFGPLAAAAVALAVVAGAALAGPWRVADRQAEPPQPVPLTERPTLEATPEFAKPVEPVESDFPVTLVLVLVGLLLLVLLLRALLRRWSWARGTTEGSYDPAAGAVTDAVEAEPEPDLPTLRRGVSAAGETLRGHRDAGDAIVAAWLELEAAAASSGVARAPSDTPTELTTAVLDATSADPAATRGLLRLYHRARFAPHAVIGADDVAEAERCLQALARSWEER